MKAIALIKQLQLVNSIFRGRWKLTKEMLLYTPKEEVKAFAVREMTIQLADKIMREHPTAIIEEDGENHNTMVVELLVLEMSQFKDIVEAAVGLLSDEQIARIRAFIEVIE